MKWVLIGGITVLIAVILMGILGGYIGSVSSSSNMQTQYLGQISENLILDTSPKALSIPSNAVGGNFFTMNYFSGTQNNQSFMIFDGVNDRIDNAATLNGMAFTEKTNFTFSIWYKTDTCTIAQNTSWAVGLMGKNFPQGVAMGLNNGKSCGQATWGIRNESSQYTSTTATIPNPLGQWHNLIGTYNSTDKNLSLYVDGELKSSVIETTINVNSLSSFTVGGDVAIGGKINYLMGYVDEARVYNRTLIGTEAAQINNSGRIANASLPSDGLVLWWKFDEGQGTTVYDSSGMGNNGQ